MEKINIKLENCYGINKLNHTIEFNNKKGYLIYAPNGTMKSSFAKTFEDISKGNDSQELVFNHETIRKVTNEDDEDLKKSEVYVINTFNDSIKFNKISKLLINQDLKNEYNDILKVINNIKKDLLKIFKNHLKRIVKNNLEIEELFITDLSEYGDNFLKIILNFPNMPDYKLDVNKLKYYILFDEKNLNLILGEDTVPLIKDYCEKYNELIENSEILKKEFNHNNATKLDSELNSLGYFKAEHELKLRNGTIIKDENELNKLIIKEKNSILKDMESEFDKIDGKLEKSKNNFNQIIQDFQDTILEDYLDIGLFKEKIWISILHDNEELVNKLIEFYNDNKERLAEIIEKANEEKSQWEKTISIFNNRFHVPFEIRIDEKRENLLINNKEPSIEFYYNDENENKSLEQKELMDILSTGEKRALYILNIIYELELKKLEGKPLLLVLDDLADSFDYENKYAIIEYLNDLLEDDLFKLIILTHNFDFCRAISSRLDISRENIYIAERNQEAITLTQADYIKNAFTAWKRDLKGNYRNSEFIASIPFLRNIIEYTKSEDDDDYITLTNVLHLKEETMDLKLEDIYEIFERTIDIPLTKKKQTPIWQFIMTESNKIVNSQEYLKLEDKLTLAIAIRLLSEKFMLDNIEDDSSIESNQTRELYNRFKSEFPEFGELNTLDEVMLVTPEYIHINAFMYEPLIDLKGDKLKRLYSKVKSLRL
ncbi:hypothetical protein [Methanobrevibacter sp. UBA212]|uniref:hypothetical protein n=1 Tax=Methanobrevibacter sp. UBA212 TaxID=1915476 RepID=UPI0025F42C64|nr:hypothetical protein [Methanobrevibacter sp. UBA212]